MERKIYAVCGPTAVGKTKFAIAIAQFLGGESSPVIPCNYINIWISAAPSHQLRKELPSDTILSMRSILLNLFRRQNIKNWPKRLSSRSLLRKCTRSLPAVRDSISTHCFTIWISAHRRETRLFEKPSIRKRKSSALRPCTRGWKRRILRLRRGFILTISKRWCGRWKPQRAVTG